MATTQRQFPGAPVTGTYVRTAGLSGATTGIKQQYTVPAGRQAVVRAAGAFPTAGAATIALQASLNANVVNVSSGTVSQQVGGGQCLDAGDTFRVNVTALDAASVFDFYCCVEEYLAQ